MNLKRLMKISDGRKDITPEHEAKLRASVNEMAREIDSILRKLTRLDPGMNNYLADLAQDQGWVEKLREVKFEMKDFANGNNF